MKKRKIIISLTCLIVIGVISVIFLAQERDVRQLTQKEIGEVNKAFEQIIPSDEPTQEFMINPICYFFSSYYEKPQDINLMQFIKSFGIGEELRNDNPDDRKQFEELKKLSDFPFQHVQSLKDMPVPIQRKSVASVNKVLSKYAGITVDDLKDTRDVLYLEKPYASFYTYSSDADAGFFNCNGGEIDGNTIRLFSDSATLTLEKQNDQYLIISHIKLEI